MSELISKSPEPDVERYFAAADLELAEALLSELREDLEASTFTICLLAVRTAVPAQRLDVLAFCHELREMPSGERLGVARAIYSAAEDRRLEEFALLRTLTSEQAAPRGLWDIVGQNVSGLLDGFTHPILINYLKSVPQQQRPLAFMKAEKALAAPGALPRLFRALGLLAEGYRSR